MWKSFNFVLKDRCLQTHPWMTVAQGPPDVGAHLVGPSLSMVTTCSSWFPLHSRPAWTAGPLAHTRQSLPPLLAPASSPAPENPTVP